MLWKYSKIDTTLHEETGRVSLSYLFEVCDIRSCHVGWLLGWERRITPGAPVCLGFRCCWSGRQSRRWDAVMPVGVSVSHRVDQRVALWCDSTSPLYLFYEKCYCCQPLKIMWLCKTLALSLLLLCQISLNLHADPLPAPVWAQSSRFDTRNLHIHSTFVQIVFSALKSCNGLLLF